MIAKLRDSVRAASGRSLSIVSGARLVLSAFLLLSTVAGPEVSGSAGFVRALLGAYLMYSLGLALLLRSRRCASVMRDGTVLLLSVDFALAISLLYLTTGANSPFFSALVFAIVSATLLYGSRGALAGSGLALVGFIPASLMALIGTNAGPDAVQHSVVRLGYLLVVALLLYAVGRHLERIVAELARLSHPLPEQMADDDPPMQICLEHALGVFGAQAGAVIANEAEEPGGHLLTLSVGQGPKLAKLWQAQMLALPEDQDAYICHRAGDHLILIAGRKKHAVPLSPPLASALTFERALVIRLTAQPFEGWLFVFDPDDPANEDLAIAGIVAAQANMTIARWVGVRSKRDVAASEARMSFARDLHDGVLQMLASSVLQIDSLLRGAMLDSEATNQLKQLRLNLVDEQREIRGLLTATRGGDGPSLNVAAELLALVDRLRRDWNTQIDVEVSPAELQLGGPSIFDITRWIREGVSNAVRHGGARRIAVRLAKSDDRLSLSVHDDGRGFGCPTNRTGDQLLQQDLAPRSLHERARAWGGTMSVHSSPSGSEVRVEWMTES